MPKATNNLCNAEQDAAFLFFLFLGMHDNISTNKFWADNGTFILLCIISPLVIIADKLSADNTKADCF